MAIRSVAGTDTLETFRTTFNSLAATDIGDNASLSTTEKGSIVGAINEINTTITATGWTVTDGTTSQTIVSGNSCRYYWYKCCCKCNRYFNSITRKYVS